MAKSKDTQHEVDKGTRAISFCAGLVYGIAIGIVVAGMKREKDEAESRKALRLTNLEMSQNETRLAVGVLVEREELTPIELRRAMEDRRRRIHEEAVHGPTT